MKIIEFKEYSHYFGYISLEVIIEKPEELLDRVREYAGGIEVQILSPLPIAGEPHLFAAGLNALKAFKNRINISKSLSIEFLLYLSGQRQIRNAIDLFGVKSGSQGLVVTAFSKKKTLLKKFLLTVHELIQGKEAISIIECWSDEKYSMIKRLFNISDQTVKSVRREGESNEEVLKKLVFECVTLLAIKI